MKSILKNSNGNAVSTGGKLFTVSANYTDQIKQALIDKGVATEDTPSSELVSKIESISVSGNAWREFFDLKQNANSIFKNYQGEEITGIRYNDTENITKATYMFSGSNNLLKVPHINLSNCTNIEYFCASCKSLIDLPQLDTRKLEYINNAFEYCYKLKKIDLSSLDSLGSTSSNTTSMCWVCVSLTTLIIREMTKIPAIASTVFQSCYHFDGTVHSTYNPEGLKDGRIYVPDNMVEQLKTATNWSKYADIIVPLSTLVED